MHFASPIFLWLTLLLAPLVAAFLVWAWRQRAVAMQRFISSRLLQQLTTGVSPRRKILRLVLVGAAVVLATLSLARPQWGTRWEEAKQRGLDIIVAIDTSRSMLATDTLPNRIERAKLESLSLIEKARNDRFGLVAFAGSAFLQCPLTLDDEAFRQSLRALDVNIIPQGGTSIGAAISAAVEAFREAGENMKVLILFTDGEDHEAGAADAARTAAEEGVRIFTIGVGSPAGDLIRVRDEKGNESFLMDESGNAIKSRLNESLLREVATIGKGFFLPLKGPDTIGALYERGLEPLPRAEFQARLIQQRKERFYWPLGFAIVLLIVEMLISERPSSRRASAPLAKASAVTAVVLICLGVGLAPATAIASSASAQKAYERGDYKAALTEYERLLERSSRDPRLSYNAGNAAFQAGLFGRAAEFFGNCLTSPDLNLQQQAYYNLGNASYRLGEQAESPEEKSRAWERAIDNFNAAVELNPSDIDAKFNYDLVKRKLEELEKQQQQQQNQQQSGNDSKEQKDNKSEQEKKQQSSKQEQQQKQGSQPKSQPQKKDEQTKSEPKSQPQAKQDQSKSGQSGDQKDKAAKKQSDGKKEDQAEPQLNPGQVQYSIMTQSQAENMLDAQRSEDRILIFGPAKLTNQPNDRVMKNW